MSTSNSPLDNLPDGFWPIIITLAICMLLVVVVLMGGRIPDEVFWMAAGRTLLP